MAGRAQRAESVSERRRARARVPVPVRVRGLVAATLLLLAGVASGRCPPQPVFKADAVVEVTTCSGREFRDTCHAECKDGFLGEGAIWICESDNAWDNPVRHSCQAVSCGEPDFEADNLVASSVVQPCSSNSFGGSCPVTCQPGHATTGPQALNNFELYCNAAGEWETTDNVTCVDIDGCDARPCDARVSECEDRVAPLDGWVCRCKDGLWSDERPNGDGSECRASQVDLRGGALDFQTGAGLDVHFAQGTLPRSARDLDAAIAAQRARVSDPAELAASRAEILALTEQGIVGDNRRRVDDLTSPTGVVTRQGERVALLQAAATQVADRMQQETTRATAVDATQARTLSQLRTEQQRIFDEHSTLINDHAATKSFAASLVGDVNALSATNRAAESSIRNLTADSQATADRLRVDINNLTCASRPTVDQLVAALRREFQQTVQAMVLPIVEAECLNSGFAFDSAAGACVLPPLGTHPSRPATSCRALLAEAHGRASGRYWVQLPGLSEAEQVYCDQARNGGGWELVMKMVPGRTFQYDSEHWCSETTVNDLSLDDSSSDAKMNTYNHGVYDEVVAYFSDAGFSWQWRLPLAGSQPLSTYFCTPRVLSTSARTTPEFAAAQNRFSFQNAYNRYVISTCSSVSTNQCVRWGFLFNNQNEDRSINVIGGFGVKMSNDIWSVGDAYTCCGTRRSDHGFAARIYARVKA